MRLITDKRGNVFKVECVNEDGTLNVESVATNFRYVNVPASEFEER